MNEGDSGAVREATGGCAGFEGKSFVKASWQAAWPECRAPEHLNGVPFRRHTGDGGCGQDSRGGGSVQLSSCV